MNTRKLDSKQFRNQAGTTLVVALVILLVMSVIGVTNMQSSTMQERMAANNRQKSLAKYAAESALNVAEEWLENNVKRSSHLAQFSSGNGLYSALDVASNVTKAPSSGDIADVTDGSAWGEITAYSGVSNIIEAGLVSHQPQYIIEYIGRDYRGSANKVIGTDDLSHSAESNYSKPYFFRITAIGWGKDKKIYAVLESIYKTGSGDFFSY